MQIPVQPFCSRAFVFDRYVPSADPTSRKNPFTISGKTISRYPLVLTDLDDGSNVLNTGGRYNPSTDSWTATSTTNAPSARADHTAVWTGSEMIVWGGGDAATFEHWREIQSQHR